MKRHIESLITRINTVDLCAIDLNGYPTVKTVMKPRLHEGLAVMYFTTLMSSKTVSYYKNNSKASVYFVDKDRFQSALFVGEMHIVDDASIIELLKEKETGLIFNHERIDHDYCVLKFVAHQVTGMVNFESETFAI